MKNNQLNSMLILCIVMLAMYSSQSYAQNNVALNKSVTASAGFSNLPLLVDGIRVNATNAMTGSAAVTPEAEWFEIDLGDDYFIDSIVITASNDEVLSRRFMLVTRPSNVALPVGLAADQPYYYLSQGLFNRLIYTEPPTSSNEPFNTLFSNTAPHPAGEFLGPIYPIVNGEKIISLNIGIHKTRFVRIFNLQNGALSFGEIEVYTTTKQPIRSFVNGDFEEGDLDPAEGIQFISEANMPGWSTTEAMGMWDFKTFNQIPNRGTLIEIWQESNSIEGQVYPYSGKYFAELNAHTNGMIVQEPICLLPNEIFDWSFAHRGRLGVDEMALVINYEMVARFRDNNEMNGTHEIVPGSVVAGTTATKGATNEDGWTLYSGTWTNTSPTSNVVTFGFSAVETSNDVLSIGNYIDQVSIVTRSSVASFNETSTVGSENLSVALLPKIKLSGNVITGSSISLQITGGSAILGTHYTTSTNTNTINIEVPAGVYDESDLTAIALTDYIQVIPQSIPDHESDKTIEFTIIPETGNILIPEIGTGFCQTVHNKSIYTILEASLLPVSFGNVSVFAMGKDQVKIQWSTFSEQNNQYFKVEHSLDGMTWKEIGTVHTLAINGNSQQKLNYEFMGSNVGFGVHYYRIKQVDLDNKSSYSNIAKLEWKKSSTQLNVYPNPFDHSLNFRMNSPEEVKEMIIYDISGKTLWKNAGFASYLDTQSFPVGMYILKVIYRNELSEMIKLVKKQ